MIGVALRMAIFPQSLIAAEWAGHESSHSRQTLHLITFGCSKAATCLFVGAAADRYGRKHVHAAGWLVGLALPATLFLALSAHSWGLVVFSDLFLGLHQGVTWSTNIFSLMDILGPQHRALANGLSNSHRFGLCNAAL